MVRRRKNVWNQIQAERKRAKAARERESRRIRAQQEREARAQQLAHDRAVAAEQRKAAQVEREAQRRVAARARERERSARLAQAEDRRRQQTEGTAAAAEVARRKRAAIDESRAQRKRDRARRERARADLAQEVEAQNKAIRASLEELEALLGYRLRRASVTPLELESALTRSGLAGFCERVQQALTTSPYPLNIPSGVKVLGYRPEARELLIERELPRDDAIPARQEVRIISGETRTVARKATEIRRLYGRLLARVALRTLADAFISTPPTLVDTIVLNGWVTAVDRATGKVVNPLLLSVQFDREAFDELSLDASELDPELCLRAQHALIAPHPHDLVPVKPLIYYDLERFKTIAGTDLLVDLDSRLDLLILTPTEFENLIRQLSEARGLKSWQTQTSRDDGVDAVAVNEDPVLGGLAIIQASDTASLSGTKRSLLWPAS